MPGLSLGRRDPGDGDASSLPPSWLQRPRHPGRAATAEETVLFLVALSLASAAISLLISRSVILAPFRLRLPPFLREGISCPFCVGFWSSLGLVLAFGPPPGLTVPLAILATWGGSTFAAVVSDSG